MKVEQTLSEALRITLKIWPYVLLNLGFGFSSLLFSQIADPFVLLCLSIPIAVMSYLVGILLYRVMFYAMDEKDLHFSNTTADLMRPAGRVLGLSIVSSVVIGLVFLALGLAAVFLLAIVAGSLPQMTDQSLTILLLFSGALILLPVFLVFGMYAPMAVGAIVDRDQKIGDALRKAHNLVKAHGRQLFGWVLLLTLPNTVLSILVGMLAQQSGDWQLTTVLAYIAVMVFGFFLQCAWAVIYRQLSKPEVTPKARRARVSS